MDPENFKKLIELSKMDSLIDDLSKALGDFPKVYSQLEKAKAEYLAEFDKVVQSRKKLLLSIKEAENTLLETEATIEKRKSELNSLKSPDAIKAAMEEIESLSLKSASLESLALSAMEEEASLANEEKKAEVRMKENISKVDAQLSDARKKEKDLSLLLSEKKKQRADFASSIDAKSLEKYESIAARKKPPIVKGEKRNGKIFCGGCSMAITSAQVDELNKGALFVVCQNCFRMIYI